MEDTYDCDDTEVERPDDGHVFALAGLAGSGKSTAAEIIENECKANFEYAISTEVSDFVRSMFEQETGETTDDNALGRWAADKKDEHGDGYFVRAMAETLADGRRPHVAISGLRSPEEAEELRDVFGPENVTVIAVWTLPDLRFERKYGDTPHEEHPEWATFTERNQRETYDWGCVEYFLSDGPSDYIVQNNETVAELERALHAIVHEAALDGSKRASMYRESPFPHDDPERVGQYL